MNKKLENKIAELHNTHNIHLINIKEVKRFALEHKMYDIIELINNNYPEYYSFIISFYTKK